MTKPVILLCLLAALSACGNSALFGGNQAPAEEVIVVEPAATMELDCPEGTDLPDCPA